MNAKPRDQERGAALIMALMLVAVFGMLTSTLIHGDRQLAIDSIEELAGMQALQAADGGIEQARWRLQQDGQFAGEEIRIGNAEVVIKILRTATQPARWQVTATATCRPRGANGLPLRRRIVADLLAGEGLPVVSYWHEPGLRH